MLKRELKFSTYLLPLVMVSLFPHIGYADTKVTLIPIETKALIGNEDAPQAPSFSGQDRAPDSTTPPAQAAVTAPTTSQASALIDSSGNISGVQINGKNYTFAQAAALVAQTANQNAVPAPAQQNLPPAKDLPSFLQKAAASNPASEQAGMLDLSQLNDVVRGGVSIKVTGRQASLEGPIADACSNHLEVYLTDESTPSLYAQVGDSKYVGFAVHNDGQFLACMKKPENNCTFSKACHSISMAPGAGTYKFDGKETVKLAYLNDRSSGPIPASPPIKIAGGTGLFKSDDEMRADNERTRATALAADEKRLKQIEAENMKAFSNCIKKEDMPGLEALKDLVDVKFSDEGDRSKVIDLIRDEEKKRQKAEVDTLGSNIKKLLAKAKSSKTKLDDIDDLETQVYSYAADLDKFKEGDRITDKEYTKQQDVLASVIQKLAELKVSDDPTPDSFDEARTMIHKAISGDDGDDSDSLHPSEKVAKILKGLDKTFKRGELTAELKTCLEETYGLEGQSRASAQNDCKEAAADYSSQLKDLQKKTKNCSDSKKLKDKDFAAECKEDQKEIEALQETPSLATNAVGQEYQTAMKSAMTARQGQLGLGQSPNANIQTFTGAPASPTFANAGIPVMGAGNSFGVNQMAYSPSMMTYNPMISPLAQQSSPFNPYLMH
jgi:hypothetical protein